MNAFEQLIGESPEFLSVLRSAEIVAATDVTVLIEGDTGTGKELLAQAIHDSSNRSSKPFVTINCAALPEALVESELFGHKKGAFTGAVSDQAGYIKQAEGGTLFLDEIGELSLAVQAKLLRFIEYGECQCVGDSRTQKIDVRLVAATNRDISEQVSKGLFREDLYYRLKIVPLELP
ncbi:MAG: sigma-54 factor interaction domain-containing protein, partial [Gammaproteobacteria bacterium]|nr:sigma-54 factor interaction domain-containing protein [Gammaproteobacteria bacterium]